mgnify:CR=1 FL=1
MSWLKKLTSGLSKTSARVTSSLASLLGRPSIDAGSLEDLEDALISAEIARQHAIETNNENNNGGEEVE